MKLIIFHQNSDGLVHFMQRSQNHIRCGQATEYYYSGRNVVTIIDGDLYFYILADHFTDFIQNLQITPEDFEVVFGDSDDLRRKIMAGKEESVEEVEEFLIPQGWEMVAVPLKAGTHTYWECRGGSSND